MPYTTILFNMHWKKKHVILKNHFIKSSDYFTKIYVTTLNQIIYLIVTGRLTLLLLIPAGIAVAQKNSTGRLQLKIIDSATSQQTPVRVRLTQQGYAIKTLPKAAVAIMYGLWDHADGYGYQPDSSFYVNGSFEVDLPAGKYLLSLSKGNEYLRQQQELHIKPGKTLKKTYRMMRWINMPQRGWYSGDDHIHIRRSPREDSLLLTWTRAEDIHAGVMLRMGDFWQTYYPQYDWGEKGVYQRSDYFLTSGQEDPRTPELGHALGLGATDWVRFNEEYYYYDKVFDKLHQLGGLTGYAHQAKTFHGYRGLILDGLRKKVDVLELLQFCASEQPLLVDHYYHLLDLGFPVTAVAGSDFPWCGKDHDQGFPELSAQIGNARFYTYTGGPLTYQSWRTALAAGHTFVSSGPIIEFKVNDKLPGDRLDVTKGSTLTITAHAYGHPSQVPLDTLEIVVHGKILGRVTANDPNQSSSHLSIELNIPVAQGIWIAARCSAKAAQAAHTTPVYITVAGGGFHNPSTVPHYLSLSEQYLQELESQLKQISKDPQYQAWRYKSGLQMRIDETRRIIEMLKAKLK